MPINAIARNVRNNVARNNVAMEPIADFVRRRNPAMPLAANNMGNEILNPPPPLVRKLMELQAELLQHFPNNPNVVVAFNGHGGRLIGMENQAMANLLHTAYAPALPNHQRPAIGIGNNVANVRGYIG